MKMAGFLNERFYVFVVRFCRGKQKKRKKILILSFNVYLTFVIIIYLSMLTMFNNLLLEKYVIK